MTDPNPIYFAIIAALAVLAFVLLVALTIANHRIEKGRTYFEHAEAYKAALGAEVDNLKRSLLRLASAQPGRVAERDRLASGLRSARVVRAGVNAAIGEMGRTGATSVITSNGNASANVNGDVNVLQLVSAIIRAVDDAIVDLDLDAAAERAAEALERGDAVPIDDAVAGLQGRGGIRNIPIRTLQDVVKIAVAEQNSRDRLQDGPPRSRS